MDLPPSRSQLLFALDALELAFVYVSELDHAEFISARAAELLAVRDRTDLGASSEQLEPLLKFAKSDRGTRHEGPLRRQRLRQLLLPGASGPIPALAVCRSIAALGPSTPGEEAGGRLVLFYDLSAYEPFLKTLDQSRAVRPFVIMTSALTGTAFNPRAITPLIEQIAQSAELEAKHRAPTDLLGAMSRAIDIVDPLIVSSMKMVLDVKQPAFLMTPQPIFLRIISHVLVEAADFSGTYGRTKITSFISKNPPQIELLFMAHRVGPIPRSAGPLELYISRRYHTSHYKVAASGESQRRRLSEEAEAYAATFAWQEKAGTAAKVLPVALDSLSDNAQLLSQLAEEAAIEIAFHMRGPELLLISAYFPLMGSGNEAVG